MSTPEITQKKKEESVYTLKTAQEVLEDEKDALQISDKKPSIGLAISGGGIRSASFGLGILQSFLEHNILQKVDYLSTVSGGGYIGSALTWFRHRHPGEDKAFFDETCPFGEKGLGGRFQSTFVMFLRQHGNYLAPGKWMNLMSAVAVLIRSLLVSVFIYFSFLLVFVSILKLIARRPALNSAYKLLEHVVIYKMFPTALSYSLPEFFRLFAVLTAGACMMFVLSAILFCLFSFVIRCSKSFAVYKYGTRNAFQLAEGVILTLIIIFAVLMTVPIVHKTIEQQIMTLGIVGYISGAWGALSTLRKFMGKTGFFKKEWIGVLLFRCSAILFVYAALVMAYHLSMKLFIFSNCSDTCIYLLLGLILLTPVLLGLTLNINDSTVGSMYRDRLMEVFLPGDKAVLENRWMPAKEADTALLETMCTDDKGGIRRPYHLINTNIILVGSKKNTYRNRGGDSFLLSPLYCGSDATGYRKTNTFIKEESDDKVGMTLATAMATSGAAVNPHTGVAGAGPTRDPFVSVMMTVFNLRLGFWATNPNIKKSERVANYIIPGLCSLIGCFGHNENNKFIELSDGGHFENLGLYELVRRRVDMIIVSDGTADKDFSFGDLANAIERIRSDFGAVIRFKKEEVTLGNMLPASFPDCPFSEKFEIAKKGYACGTIHYPSIGNEIEKKEGVILLIKSTLMPDLPADLYGYKAGNKDFPDQPTADQFFSEKQFEAYRELGYRAGESAVETIREMERQVIEYIEWGRPLKV